MSVSFPPIPAPTSSKSSTTSIPANSATPTMVSANSERVSGMILNTANKALWVRFGDPAAAPATATSPAIPLLSAALPAVQVPAGGNVDVPEGYIGPIGLIWSAGFAAGGIALFVELVP
jgi:hypothetical protein